jgi:hypothetical protein
MNDKNQSNLDQFTASSEIVSSHSQSGTDHQLEHTVEKIRQAFNFKDRIIVQFYSFTSFRNTGKYVDGSYRIRITHLLKDAPSDIIYAIIASFISNQTNNSSKKYVKQFRDYVKTDMMKEKLDCHRKIHSRKQLRGEEGGFLNLKEIFDQMNGEYFDHAITGITLTWGRHSYRTLGHYDRALKTIVISQCLDDLRIPRQIIEYVMYHEMLHHCLPMKYVNGRRKMHTREFKEKELEFKDYSMAKSYLRKHNFKQK